MPEVSRFSGIVIRFYYNDYEPAHLHAVYRKHEALIEIDTLAVIGANCPEGRWRSFWNGLHFTGENDGRIRLRR